MYLRWVGADVISPMEFAARQVSEYGWIVALVAVLVVLMVVLIRRKLKK